MPVAAASTVGTNPYLNPSLPDFAQPLSEVGDREIKNSLETETAAAAELEVEVLDMKSALSLAEEVTTGLKFKPDWVTLRLHSLFKPSLLGKNYV